jgi:hypothetical protein
MFIKSIVTSLFVLIALLAAAVRAEEQPWISLFDGKTLDGWTGRWGNAEVVDGQMVVGRAGLQYSSAFQDFDLLADVRAEPGAKGNIAFGSLEALAKAWDSNDSRIGDFFRVIIDNSRDVTYRGKTGTCGGVFNGSAWTRRQFKSVAEDGQWFKLRIWRQDSRLRIWVNDALLFDGQGTAGGKPMIDVEEGPKICFKNIRVQKLPAKAANQAAGVRAAEGDAELFRLLNSGFPLINYHIHLKGDLTLDKALEHSRATGVFYGIAANCGLNFPITNDQGINDYIKKMEGQPCFIGMQAEGREWPTLFSREAVAKFDYVFTDAMTIVDHRGKRARLWIPEEVDIPDKQAFLELLVGTIEGILDNEPVDIYANPTYLPDVLMKEYDALWTPERVKRVIDAAARNGVAIEISNRLKLPKADFIRQAQKAGLKFTLGTNNVDANLGREEYAVQMIRQCELKPGDMFLPKPDGKKPIQVRGFKSK